MAIEGVRRALHEAGFHRSGRLRGDAGLHELGRPGAGRPPVGAAEDEGRADHQGRPRGRDQLLRHRQRLLAAAAARRSPAGRCGTSRRARTSYSPPRCTAGCAPGPTARGLSRKAILHEIDASADAGSARTTSTSTRSTAGTTHTPIEETMEALHDVVQGGQGALHRRLVDVRLAVRQGAVHRRPAAAGPGSSPCRTTTTCSTARRSARCCRSAPTRASACIPWSPLARGRLTRDWDASHVAGRDRRVRRHALPRRGPLDRRDRRRGRPSAGACPRAQVALAWLLAQPAVTSPIVGVTKPQHLDGRRRRGRPRAERRRGRGARRGLRARTRSRATARPPRPPW